MDGAPNDASQIENERTPLSFKREREVLRLMAEGQSDREIANALGLKFNTVRNHMRHIVEKLGVHSRREAVWRAQLRGLV